MGKGIHTTTQQNRARLHPGLQRLLTVTILLACLVAWAAFARQPEASPEQPQVTPGQQPAKQPEQQEEVLKAGRRNVLTRMLEQLREQVRQKEDALRQETAKPAEQRQILQAELQALREQTQVVEYMLSLLGSGAPSQSPEVGGQAGKDLRAMQDRIRELEQQLRAAREEIETCRSQQCNAEEWRNEVLRQQEEQRKELLHQQEQIRNQVGGIEEQLKTATERAGAESKSLGGELDRLRTDLQRMGQTIGRLERERIEAQNSLKTDVQQLGRQVNELREDLRQVRGTMNALFSQTDTSTVGSAGRAWAW